MYRPQSFHTVNESVWTGFPHQDDGTNPPVPPLDCVDGWSIACLYNLRLVEPVSVDFSASPTAGPSPLTVAFTNLSTGDFNTCQWDFGDTFTSTLCSPPDHVYQSSDVYTVALTVSGPGGMDTETKDSYITVYTSSQADFTAAPTEGIAPLEVVFTNLSSGDFSTSLWDFGDGITSTQGSPAHTYTMAGVYTVSLTESGLGGTDTETKDSYITVYAPVSADFSANPTSGPFPLKVLFTNLSNGDFDTCLWDFGDTITSTICNPPDHVYLSPGVYTVTLTVYGLGGSDTETKAGYITVENQEFFLPVVTR
jgi:PKD repeat protein